MGILDSVEVDDSIEDKDTLGGSYVMNSGVYNMVIEGAHLDVSKGGAKFVKLHLEDSDGNRLKQDIYFTSKTGKTTFGFNELNALSVLACGKTLKEVGSETASKFVPVYDFNARKDVDVEKEVIVPWIGMPIKAGITHVKENKNAMGASGQYEKTNQMREYNEADKFFRASDNRTTTEVKEDSPAVFIDKWKAKWDGKVNDKFDPNVKAPVVTGSVEGGGTTPSPDDLFAG